MFEVEVSVISLFRLVEISGISLLLLVEISGNSLLLLVLISDGLLYPFPPSVSLVIWEYKFQVPSSSSCTDGGVSLVEGLNPWLLFAG